MNQNSHFAIDGSVLSKESTFIKNLLQGSASGPFQNLKGKTGVLFSNSTLNTFIKEEAIHDDFTLTKNEHRSIQTFSSGEQKKALLNYLISQKPGFLILENAFDMLDKESQFYLSSKLDELSKTITIIQIFSRKDNILPFINYVLRLQNDSILFFGTVAEYKKQFQESRSFTLKGNIPPAPIEFEPITNPLIQFKNVSVNYGEKNILNSINWEIKQGDFWQLTGANGSGKTTLLTMITGDNPQAYGQNLMLFGRKKGSGESIWEIKKKIGFVTPAMTVLFKGRHTVESMVISGLYDSIGLYKKPTDLEKKLSYQWIDLIGLTELKHTRFAELSEGQQCMVLLARSMIKHPPLLILDEPAHGLDDHNVSVFTALINKIAEESKTTIIYVSHKKEKGLNPAFIYELFPTKKGSEGKVKKTF